MAAKSRPQEEVIKDFIEVHGNKFDYSKVTYTGASKNIIIICPIHGDFKLMAGKHKLGRGCKDCRKIKEKEERLSKAKQYVIEKFREVHGDFYNYDKVVYNRNDEKVIITCPVHGDFPQAPAGHKRGEKCPSCSLEKRSSDRIEKTKTTIIKDFKKVHGNRYNYDKVVYEDSKKNVIIVCPIHGDFPKTPNSHKAGKGCHKCAMESPTGWGYTEWQKAGEKSKNFDNFKVYILRCWNDEEEFYKIGKTFTKIKLRYSRKKEMPYNFEICKIIISKDFRFICELEERLKRENRNNKYLPLTYFGGRNECFSKIN